MTVKLRAYLNAIININDTQADRIVSCFKPIKVKKSTILISAGETCWELFFVHSGCIRTYYLTKQGHEKTRYIAFENSIVGAIYSFISQQPSFEFVDALEQSVLYSISHKDFYQLTAEIPQWQKFYVTLLETAYLYQNKKIENRITVSAKERFEKLMAAKPLFVQRLSNKVLASYLDITQETLSRLKSK